MSKPVTNVEIEDVLSSIRRLVSSSDRAERTKSEPKDAFADKLVLTPSLRVDDAVSGADEATESDENQDIVEHTSSDKHGAEDVLEDARLEEVADSEQEADAEFLRFVANEAEAENAPAASKEAEPEAETEGDSDTDEALERLTEILSEDPSNSLEFLTRDETAGVSEEGDETGLQDILDSADADEGETELSDAYDADNLRQKAVEFETIVAERDDHWDPDGTTHDDNAAVYGGPVPWKDTEDGDEDEDGAEDNAVDYSADPLSVFDRVADTSDEETGLEDTDRVDEEDAEAVAEEAPVLDEPDVAEAADDTGAEDETDAAEAAADDVGAADEADASEDDVEADPETLILEAALNNAAETSEPTEFTFRARDRNAPFEMAAGTGAEAADADFDAGTDMSAEETLLDEEALRDIVSEIVRQELQGALGERITRNVRKLVRREIHRALASQKLE